MTLNPKVKYYLIRSAKNAVHAGLTALGPIALWHKQFYFSNWTGAKHVLLIFGSAAVVGELAYWYPIVYAWSQSNGNSSN